MAAAQKKSTGRTGTAKPKGTAAGKKTAAAAATKSTGAKKTSSSKTSSRTQTAKASGRKTTAKGYSSSKKKKDSVQADYTVLKDIAVIVLLVFCIILQLSCFLTGGGLMQLLHTYNFSWFGVMAYFMPVLLFLLFCFIISNWRNRGLFKKVFAVVLGFLSVEAVLSILYESTDFFRMGGGAVGHAIFRVTYGALGIMGSYVLMAAVILISLVLFFGHSVISGIHRNSKNAYRAVSSHHKLQQGKRMIRAQEKRLHRQQEENEQLERQRIRLENLQKQRQEVLERGNVIREFVNIQLEESKKQEEESRKLQKQQGTTGKREFRTNTELEEEDRGMKEIVLGREENDLNQETQPKQPSMFIEGEEIPSDFSQFFKENFENFDKEEEESEHSLSKPLKLDIDENVSEQEESVHVSRPDHTFEPELKPEFEPESEFQSEPKAELASGKNQEQEFETEFDHENELRSELDDGWLREPEESESDPDLGEDISGAAEAGDEAADYRLLTKEEDDEKAMTKTVRTATGKVITVELDGLPGENKRPKDPAKIKEKLDQYDEKVVPIAYEEPKEYVFPPLDLLTPGSTSGKGKEEIARSMKETAEKLKRTLQDFGVGVTITNISRGPSVTRYELQPEQGVKVSRIVNLADDIKLNLAAEDIRIEAPIPGKAAIGIEVPNKEKQTVAFRDLLESDEFTKAKSKTVFAAGKDIAGKTVVADIEKMPHLLIAGQTGSGKSVCINTIIMSILYKARPSEVKLIMIDPKVVELSVYNGIPHLLIPVVTDPKKAAAALNWAVNEMEERYKKFAQYKARNIIGYNAQIDQIKDVPGEDRPEKIPQIIVIVDELADLMMTAGTDVEDAIQKLAQKARAAGIHLIIATQRPSVNVITGVIKANIPSRIAFSVASGIDSRTILDETGAEKLLGKGDMLFHPYYISKPVRVQGAFVSDDEVTEVVNFLTQQKNVKGGEINTNIDLQANMPGSKLPGDEQDELFETAGRFIIEQEKASIGNLQRHLRIGFNRAARIMDQLYAAGVVSKDEGTKPRKVLMKAEEFEEYLAGRQ